MPLTLSGENIFGSSYQTLNATASSPVEASSEQGYTDILSNGFNSLMDGVSSFFDFSIQDQLAQQFPERFPPTNTDVVIDTTRQESAAANSANAGGFMGNISNDQIIMAVGGLVGLIVLAKVLR